MQLQKGMVSFDSLFEVQFIMEEKAWLPQAESKE